MFVWSLGLDDSDMEDYEEAAVLKRKIKVLEDTLGESVRYETRPSAAGASTAASAKAGTSPKPKKKPMSQLQHGEDLWQMPPEDMKLIEDERIFIERSMPWCESSQVAKWHVFNLFFLLF